MLLRFFQVMWLGTIAWAGFWAFALLNGAETDSTGQFLAVVMIGGAPMLALGLLAYIVRPS